MTNTEIKILMQKMMENQLMGRNSQALKEMQSILDHAVIETGYELPQVDEIYLGDPASAGVPVTTTDGYRFINTVTGADGGVTYTATRIYTWSVATSLYVESTPVERNVVVNDDDGFTYVLNAAPAWVRIPTPQ